VVVVMMIVMVVVVVVMMIVMVVVVVVMMIVMVVVLVVMMTVMVVVVVVMMMMMMCWMKEDCVRVVELRVFEIARLLDRRHEVHEITSRLKRNERVLDAERVHVSEPADDCEVAVHLFDALVHAVGEEAQLHLCEVGHVNAEGGRKVTKRVGDARGVRVVEADCAGARDARMLQKCEEGLRLLIIRGHRPREVRVLELVAQARTRRGVGHLRRLRVPVDVAGADGRARAHRAD